MHLAWGKTSRSCGCGAGVRGQERSSKTNDALTLFGRNRSL